MDFLKIFTDGGARGNPGPAASAFVVYDPSDKEIHHEFLNIGSTTNNVAEYSAVLMAVKWLKTNYKNFENPVLFYLDSLLVVKQLNKEFKIKNESLNRLAKEIFQILKEFKNVKFNHVPREKNIRADELVNYSLDR